MTMYDNDDELYDNDDMYYVLYLCICVLLQSALLQSAPLHSWFSFLVVPDLLCS